MSMPYAFGSYDNWKCNPPEEPEPPGWWKDYENACYDIGVEPRELDWEDGEADAVTHMEEIRDAAITALKYL